MITKAELEDENFSLMRELENELYHNKPKLETKNDYKRLISLLLGGLHLFYHDQSFNRSDHVKETTNRLIRKASLSDRLELPEKIVKFDELKSKPLGDIKRKKSKQRLFQGFYRLFRRDTASKSMNVSHTSQRHTLKKSSLLLSVALCSSLL